MAKKKQEEAKKGLDEWMATYSDMVTLLMCFFVLLYASSTPDETKWQYIFQAFTTQGTYINPFVTEENPNAQKATEEDDGNSDTPASNENGEKGSSGDDSKGTVPQNFEDLSAWFKAAVQDSNLEGSISISESSSRINIRFDNSIMFDGDSAVLKQSGQDALNLLKPGVKALNEYIKTIKVSGHTATGISRINDWDLSAARACSVTKFMDFGKFVPSEKFIPEGRGPYDPVDTNETDEGKEKNRRVELVIIRNNVAVEDTNIHKDILKYDYGIGHKVTDPDDRQDTNIDDYTDDQVKQILDDLNDKYEKNDAVEVPDTNVYPGPAIGEGGIYEIPQDILMEETAPPETEPPETEAETAAETEAST